MRSLFLILLWTFAYAGSPAQDWLSMSQAQRDFAYRCIEWGRGHKIEYYYTITGDTLDLGETLAAIGWMESSLGADNEHGEDSSGPFGIRHKTIRGSEHILVGKSDSYREGYPDNIVGNLERNFNFAARYSILIYLDNIRYIKQWHKNRGLTITDREAWRLASQVYRDGTNWQRRAEYGRIFRQRVKFLRTLRRPYD